MEDDAARSEPGIDPVSQDGGDAAEKLRQLEEELARLKEQIAGSEDQSRTKEPVSEPAASEQEPPEQRPLSADEQAEVEALVKQAQLAKIRKQNSVATKLLKEAAEKAPRSAVVLEALGDDLMERKMYNGAADSYGKAVVLDPANVALERKHADAIYYGQAAGLGLELEDDTLASPRARIFLAAILPGVGQMVRGAVAKGALIMGGFVISLIVTGVIKAENDKRPTPENRFLFILPLAFALVFWMWGILDASAGRKEGPRRIDRPKPPVDLPFE